MFEPRKERLPRGECLLIEIRKLKQQDTELRAKYFHHLEERMHLFLAPLQAPFVSDDLRNLGGNYEVFRSTGVPVADRPFSRRSIPGTVDFDGIELLRIVVEIVGRLHAAGIKSSLP